AFEAVGLPVAPYRAVETLDDLRDAAHAVGVPGVVKRRTGGYDGRGQVVVTHEDQLERAWNDLGGEPCLYEAFVKFTRELSVVGARGADGSFAVFPLNENTHRGGILHETISPAAGVSEQMRTQIEAWHRALCERFGHVGVL